MPNAANSEQDLATRFLALPGLAQDLGHLAMGYFNNRESLNTRMKGTQDFITEADGAVEARFRALIAEAFPSDSVMGEEMGGGNSDRLWIIDPIDGTANFARGDRMWCISIGFVVGGVPTLGLIYAPALDETFLARRGGGATLNGKPIRAAGTDEIAQATIEFGWSSRLPTSDYLDAVARLFETGAHVKRCASGALGMAHVAAGRTDAYGELHINAWDVAAGIVIASEAGARVNDFCTGDWLNDGNPILATAPALWGPISEASRIR
jgi:myo-inositol-1(or 4)-monophosphatase